MKLEQMNAQVICPAYDRNTLKSKIVHIGLGAFHRGHQAFLLNQLQNQSPSDWGICAINLIGGLQIVEDLQKQNHLYTVLEKADKQQATIVGSIIETLHTDINGINAIIAKLCEPQVAIITLTVTEKGYCTLPGGLALDVENSLIIHDLQNFDSPKSVPALLYKALKQRQRLGLPPITILSCDNMPENGHATKNAVLGFTQLVEPEFIDWIKRNVSFPSSMVDRIVPALTPASLHEVEVAIGQKDPCGIVTEPFIQWVIEDNFLAGRPAWQTLHGVTLANDVIPFEEMKLRMLNGSHSFLAYLGNLAGYENISDCMDDPDYRNACRQLMLKEQAVTLTTKNVDFVAYADTLIERFENKSLKHKTKQIAMDGSQKIPQRFLASIQWHIDNKSDYSLLALAVAGWIRYVSDLTDKNLVEEINDPMANLLATSCQSSEEGTQRVHALLNIDAIFGKALPTNPTFVKCIEDAYQNILTLGAKASIVKYLAD